MSDSSGLSARGGTGPTGRTIDDTPRQVCWLHPVELLRTSWHALFSTIVSGYLDRRESLAALDTPAGLRSHSGSEPRATLEPPEVDSFDAEASEDPGFVDRGLWVDFCADIGDSWEATYATASLVAQPLEVRGHACHLPASDVLVLGGDLVYPTPTRDGYRRRTQQPFEAARPWSQPGEVAPTMLAIPGNHDWYDGLTNFVRTFCQGGFIGGWRLVQRRSYFAVKLTPGWWLWGIDIALDTRIDPPQRAYFYEILNGTGAAFAPGDRVILCTARPSWLQTSRFSDDAYHNLSHFVCDMVEAHGGEVPLILSGDLHHYCRHSDGAGRHLIVAGGGGSYTVGTTHVPERVPPLSSQSADPGKQSSGDGFVRSQFTFPDRADSRRLALGALGLALRPRNWSFCLLLGIIYLLFDRVATYRDASAIPIGLARSTGATWLPLQGTGVLTFTIAIVVVTVLLATVSNRRSTRWLTIPWGALHGVMHLAAALVLGWLLSRPPSFVSELGVVTVAWIPLDAWIVGVMTVLAGGLVGATLFGAYLVVSDRYLDLHGNEVFAALASIDHRCFIRLHLRSDGAVDIYPIGLRRVPRRWRRAEPDAAGGRRTKPVFEPADAELTPHLIEGPITIEAVAPERT